jgi:hypothetical protein
VARNSFTFKQSTNASVGSFLQISPSYFAGSDDASALRSDGYVTAPTNTSGTELFLDAEATGYSTITLDWQINGSLATVITATPQVTALLLVYSPVGAPQTVADGTLLNNITSAAGTYVHTGLNSGSWAYYSLFSQYEGIGVNSWYELIGSTEVLVPKNYGSTDDLWKRIPRHYRLADESSGNTPSSNDGDGHPLVGGPLYRTLSVFGWDIDKMRTLVDYQMVAKDPANAATEALNALAFEVGLPITATDLGPIRLRNALWNVRTNTSTKGTLAGVERTLSNLTGSVVEIVPTRPNLLTAAQRAFSGGFTPASAGLPTGSQWSYTSAASLAASAGGVRVSRASGTDFALALISTRVTISNAEQYRSYYDVLPATGASVVGSMMTGASVSLSSFTFDSVTGVVSEVPAGFQAQLSGGDRWYQAPQTHGIVGNGSYTSGTVYLTIAVVMNATGALLLRNPSVNSRNNYPYVINVYSQRVNLIKDPRFTTSTLNTGASGSANYWCVYPTAGSCTAAVGSTSLSITSATGASVSVNTNVTGNYFATRTGVPYNFSIIDDKESIASVRLVSVTYGVIASATIPYAVEQTAAGKRRYWELLKAYDAPWFPLNISDCYFEFSLGVTGTVLLQQPLFEPLLRYGAYFDGSSTNGGWLRGTGSTGRSDYRWGSGGTNTDFSYYSTDYGRMVSTVNRVIQYYVPVTESNASASLFFNKIIGS